MKGLEFPLVGTKVPGLSQRFGMSDPEQRKKYFEAKVGPEIKLLKDYFKSRKFLAFFLGKKNAGKGTYSKLLTEIFTEEKIVHVSVGDLIREVHGNWDTFSKSKKFADLARVYRGYISFDEAIEALLGRSTAKLLPSEFIIALLKVQIPELGQKTIFLDGFPRESDQISYALFFRDLINYSNDPDIFILIDIPEVVINERMKYRVVCPLCNTSRNIKLLPTSKIYYDTKNREFYLFCDNPKCRGARMEAKEGDELGIAPIKARLVKDEQILKEVYALHGIPKVLLRNHVSVSEAAKYFDDWELTPEYSYDYDEKKKTVRVTERPWTVRDDNGVDSYSLLAPPVVVSMIKQLVKVLNL